MLTKLFSPALLDTVFDRAADSLPCPPAADRAFWESLAERPPRNAWKEELLHRAEAAVAAPETLWPQLRAFQGRSASSVTGNRTDYETIYFQRRFHFSLLVLAECLEYRGRFLPEVVEGLWALLSEPFWYVPAHAHYRLAGPDAPLRLAADRSLRGGNRHAAGRCGPAARPGAGSGLARTAPLDPGGGPAAGSSRRWNGRGKTPPGGSPGAQLDPV